MKAEIKTRALDFRNLQRLMESPDFELAWTKDSENVFVRFAIASGHVEEVKKWIKQTLTEEVGEMNMRQLRSRAAVLGVARVSLFSKDELILKIVHIQNAAKASQSPESMSHNG